MTIEFMRAIDYWLGRPLVFIITCFDYLIRPFGFKKNGKKVTKRILLIKLSEMGSIILSLPLIVKIKNDFPESEIYYLTFKQNEPLLKMLGLVAQDNIFVIRGERFDRLLIDSIKSIYKLRKKRLDFVLDLEFFSRFTSIISYLTNARKRAGFFQFTMEGLYRGALFTHRLQYNPLLHISKTYLAFCQIMGFLNKMTPELTSRIGDQETMLPEISISQATLKDMSGKLKKQEVKEGERIFIVNPGDGNIPLREWPLENFTSLIKELLKDKNNQIILAGIKQGFNKGQAICDSLDSERCRNLIGMTTLEELVALFNLADALITNDSGIAHIASLFSIHKFIIFGPESPRIYAPLGKNVHLIYSSLPCSPCLSVFNHRRSSCKDNKCLKSLSVREVYQRISEIIALNPLND